MYDIIEGAKQGNVKNLCEIYEKYRGTVYYFCLKLVTDADIAADLMVETFSCAFDEFESLPDYEQFEIWIKNIAAIKCFNYIHKMKPMLFLQAVADTSEPMFSASEIEAMPKGDIEETKTAAVMDMMINRLNDAQRMTIMLHYFNGLSVAQIAKIMSCDGEVVKQRMEKAAEHMKTTIEVLSDKGIHLSAVEFRAALHLIMACTVVPETVDNAMKTVIAKHAVDLPEPKAEPTDEEYIIDKYITSKHEAGEAEEATSSYFASDNVESYGESIFEKFAPKEEIPKESVITATADVVSHTAKKAGEGAKRKFLSLSMMQQSVALLVVVAIIATVIIGVSLNRNNKNPDLAPTSSTTSVNSTKSNVSVVPAPKYELEFKTENNELLGDDGVVVASASYQYPIATISQYPEAQDAINSYLNTDKSEILATFSDEQKNFEYKYAYSTKAYGEFKKNEATVTMEKGRVDEAVISFKKQKYTYLYGNVYGNTELQGYNFDTKTGKQLKISDVMADLEGYKNYASETVCAALEQKQQVGEFNLYENYASTVRRIIEQDDRWYFTDTGITVICNPDEVVFYTLGPQIFELPYSAIENYLAVEYTK